MVLLVLGGMHFFNLFIFSRMRRRATRDTIIRPSAPDAFTATAVHQEALSHASPNRALRP